MVNDDDPKKLQAAIRRWTWVYGFLGVAMLASLVVYWAYLDLGKPAFPAPLNVCFYLFGATATVLASMARSKAQLRLGQAEAKVERATERDMAREDLTDALTAFIAAMESQEDLRDRRDGLLYSRLSQIRTEVGVISRMMEDTREIRREPVAIAVGAAAVGVTYASQSRIDPEVIQIGEHLTRRLSAVKDPD